MFCIRKKGSALLSNTDLHGCHDLRSVTWFCCHRLCCHDNAVLRCNKKGKSTVRKLSTWLLYTGADTQEQGANSDLVVSCVILPEREHQPPCWTGGWWWQQSWWSQVLWKDLYFCWSLHTHWCGSSKYPWCGNTSSHYKSKQWWGIQVCWESQNDDLPRKAKTTHWLLWGKSSRCCIVTKGWPRASTGAILSSASISNIFFSRPTNSLRSAFSASKSLPSIFITKFTWKIFLVSKLQVNITSSIAINTSPHSGSMFRIC